MEPLTRLWAIVCEALEGDSERVTPAVEDINELIEQSIFYHKIKKTCLENLSLNVERFYG